MSGLAHARRVLEAERALARARWQQLRGLPAAATAVSLGYGAALDGVTCPTCHRYTVVQQLLRVDLLAGFGATAPPICHGCYMGLDGRDVDADLAVWRGMGPSDDVAPAVRPAHA